jgi:hypothetical protein
VCLKAAVYKLLAMQYEEVRKFARSYREPQGHRPVSAMTFAAPANLFALGS